MNALPSALSVMSIDPNDGSNYNNDTTTNNSSGGRQNRRPQVGGCGGSDAHNEDQDDPQSSYQQQQQQQQQSRQEQLRQDASRNNRDLRSFSDSGIPREIGVGSIGESMAGTMHVHSPGVGYELQGYDRHHHHEGYYDQQHQQLQQPQGGYDRNPLQQQGFDINEGGGRLDLPPNLADALSQLDPQQQRRAVELLLAEQQQQQMQQQGYSEQQQMQIKGGQGGFNDMKDELRPEEHFLTIALNGEFVGSQRGLGDETQVYLAAVVCS